MAREDLKPVRTEAEAKNKGRIGGLKSGAARRRKKDLREHLKALLEIKDAASGCTYAEQASLAMVQKAVGGDVAAYRAIAELVGADKPILAEPIKFASIKKPEDVLKLGGDILKYIGSQKITPKEGESLSNILSSFIKTFEAINLDKRLTALEAREDELKNKA